MPIIAVVLLHLDLTTSYWSSEEFGLYSRNWCKRFSIINTTSRHPYNEHTTSYPLGRECDQPRSTMVREEHKNMVVWSTVNDFPAADILHDIFFPGQNADEVIWRDILLKNEKRKTSQCRQRSHDFLHRTLSHHVPTCESDISWPSMWAMSGYEHNFL